MQGFGFEQVNGWSRLRGIMSRFPNLQPQVIIVDVTTGPSPTPEVEAVASALGFIDPSGEFYCFATSVHGYQLQAPATTVLGNAATDADWPAYAPPDGWSAKVNVTLDSGGLRFSNVPVRVGHIFGSGEKPYWWPAPWIFPGGTTLKVEVAQRTSAGVTGTRAFFAFVGFRRMYTDPPLPFDVLLDPFLEDTIRVLKARGDVKRVEPYAYGMSFETYPSTIGKQRVAYLPETKSVSIADGVFVVTHLMGTVDNPASTLCLEPPDASVKLDTTSGMVRFDDRPQGFRNVLGTAQEPGELCYPILIERGDTLSALMNVNTAITNATTTAPNWFVTFPGVRCFAEPRR